VKGTSPRFRQAPDVLDRSFDGEVILAAADAEGFESLSATAGGIWRLLAEPRTLDEIVTVLRGAYENEGSTIARDVESLVARLEHRGLVVRETTTDG
jgi:hypothetical protein